MRVFLILLLSLTPEMASCADEPAKPDAKAVLAKLKGEWRQFELTVPPEKRSLALAEGLEWWFLRPEKGDPLTRSYLTDWDNEAGQTVGELILNVDADPMWLDFKYQDAGSDRVFLGIIRFEGDDLRWERDWGVTTFSNYCEAKGQLPYRPKGFENPKSPIGYRLIRLKTEMK